jgi:membrane-associated phospholipid phosphatase
MAGAVAVGLVFVSRRLAALAGVAALVMAFARVYIAAHYPIDVAVGLVLGAAVAVAVYLAAHRPIASTVTALVDRGSRLRPLLTAAPPESAGTGSVR